MAIYEEALKRFAEVVPQIVEDEKVFNDFVQALGRDFDANSIEEFRTLVEQADDLKDEVKATALDAADKAQAALDYRNTAQAAATSANDDADRAESAFDATIGAGRYRETVTDGVSGPNAVADGETFVVPAGDGQNVVVYKNEAGSAVDTGIEFPTSSSIRATRKLVVDNEIAGIPRDLIQPYGSATTFGSVTRILRRGLKNSGRLKTVLIQSSPSSSGALPITLVILDKSGAPGEAVAGDTFTVDRRVELTIERNQFNIVPVDIPVTADQHLGFYSSSNRAILLSYDEPDGYTNDWFGIELDGNDQCTIGVFNPTYSLSAGFEVEVEYATPPLYGRVAGLAQRTAELEAENEVADTQLQRIEAMRQNFINRGVSTDFAYSPNDFEGATQSDRIQSAMAFIRASGTFGRLVLAHDTIDDTSTWVVAEAIVAPSNFELILDGATLKRGDGVLDNIIRNEGIVADPEHPNGLALELHPNYNIRILGINGAGIEGADIVYNAPPPNNPDADPVDWIGDDFGWRTVGVLFANVKNFEIGGQPGDPMRMTNPQCWTMSFERGIDQFWIHDLDYNTSSKNSDGMDLRNGISNGIIERLSGKTNDDIVALAAGLGIKHGKYADNYMLVGGTESSPLGNDVRNIIVNDVRGFANNGNLVRINCTAKDGCKVDGVALRKIHQTSGAGRRGQTILINQGSGYRTRAGDISNITIHDVEAALNSSIVELISVVTNLRLNKIRQNTPGGSVLSYSVPYAETESTITVTNAEVLDES